MISDSKLHLLLTADGSHTIAIGDSITYHSRHGALNESQVVYLDAGFKAAMEEFGKKLNILECGFGTGLNALMTMQNARDMGCEIRYVGLEKFPLDSDWTVQLDYPRRTGHIQDADFYFRIHAAVSNREAEVLPGFSFIKLTEDIATYKALNEYDLIYFDAFAPSSHPELWTAEVFSNMHRSLKKDGILVTYCSKSVVRKAMESAGFTIEKLPGPFGKREIVRGRKR